MDEQEEPKAHLAQKEAWGLAKLMGMSDDYAYRKSLDAYHRVAYEQREAAE